VSHYGRYIVLVNFVGTIYFEKSKIYIYIYKSLCVLLYLAKSYLWAYVHTSIEREEIRPETHLFCTLLGRSYDDPFCSVHSLVPPLQDFFIFILSRICKNIWPVTNFAKIYICRRGPRRQGHNAVAHGGRSRQEWALSVVQT
jgi:hypothetical protein